MTIGKGISGSTLKIIAVTVMIIDHIGLGIWYRLPDSGILVPEIIDAETWWMVYNIMRRIGRSSFPLFCFLLAEGFAHTKNRLRYALRLLVFALISQLPFHYAFWGFDAGLNVFFTLLIGFAALWGMTLIREKWPDPPVFITGWVLTGILAGLLSHLLDTDYAYKGVLLIVIFYVLRKNRLFSLLTGYLAFMALTTAYTLPAFILAWFYNGKRGLKTKFLFYIIYPAHLTLIYLCWTHFLP